MTVYPATTFPCVGGGTGKTRNEEMELGNGRRRKLETGDEKIFLHINCIVCPLCIQQHLLERTSATGDSREDRPSRVLWLQDYSHRTGRAEPVYGLDKLVARAAILAIIEYSRLLLHPAFELWGSAAFRRSTQQPESSKI